MARCPFCAGNEADTPPATAVYREGEILCGHGEWQVRVVPNKFPAVTFSGRPELQPDSIFFQTRDGEGIHEVIVESRDHRTSFSELSSDEARWVFQAYRDRCEEIKDTTELRYVQIFKNARPGAGASMEHAHSQLIATSDVPPFVEAELAHARQSARPARQSRSRGSLQRLTRAVLAVPLLPLLLMRLRLLRGRLHHLLRVTLYHLLQLLRHHLFFRYILFFAL